MTGASVKLANIKTGYRITAFGMRNNGVFEATTVNVTNNWLSLTLFSTAEMCLLKRHISAL